MPPSQRQQPGRGTPSQRPAPRSASRRKRERRRQQALRGTTTQRRSLRIWIGGGAAAVVVVAVVLAVVLTRGGGASPAHTTTPTPSPTAPLLAAAGSPPGTAIDGISCNTNEQLVYHIHAHLAIFVDGQRRTVPEGIGIMPPRTVIQTDSGPYVQAGACLYWLHTHTDDGVIHIESPTQRAYTLGQFFDIWGQPLGTAQVGSSTGALTVYVNGKRYTGDVRAITLTAHELIQLDVGADVAPVPFTFPPGL